MEKGKIFVRGATGEARFFVGGPLPPLTPLVTPLCERHARQKRINIKQAANKYIFSLVWLDAHKQRENIWYLVIIIGVESYNDYQVQVPDIFFLLVSVKAYKREKISNWRLTNIFFVCHVKEFVDLSVGSIMK